MKTLYFLMGFLAVVLVFELFSLVYSGDFVDADKKLGEVAFSADRPHEAIIRLHTEDGKFFCTGFVVDARYAVTAGHCLVNKKPIRIFNSSSQDTKVVAQVAGFHDRVDYGVIKGDFSHFKHYVAEFDKVSFGSFNIACGFPLGAKRMFCSYVAPMYTHRFGVKANGYLLPGNSGSPVINLETGRAVAVASSVADDGIVVVPLLGLPAAFGIEQ